MIAPLVLALAVVAPRSTAVGPQQGVPGTRYSFRMTVGSEAPIVGTVREGTHRLRVDVQKHGRPEDEYLVITHDGHRVISVHPSDGEYSVVDDSVFVRIAGVGLQAVSNTGVVRFRVHDAQISGERLGAGEAVAGLATEHYRLRQDYTVDVSPFGMHGGAVHQSVVTDYWVAARAHLLPNPLIGMLSQIGTALAQSDPDFVRRSSAVRDSLFSGTPVRIVVSISSDAKDEADKPPAVHRFEITEIEGATFDPAIWAIPAGLRRKSGISFSF
jgi:hypothetical protein